MLAVEVQKISAEQTIDLRMRVLRPTQTREACIYTEDNFNSTFHLGIICEGKIICNGTFIQQANEKLDKIKKSNLPYRLRGMATEPEFQKQGLGKKIILAAENELKQKAADLLWFNARTSAEGFYRKLGYIAIEEIFIIDTIGPHKVMYKYF